jgi:fluoride ion exporter CrcB/FEX
MKNVSLHLYYLVPGALTRYQVGQMAAKFIAQDPKQYGKLSGWHTAGINVAGSFLLGGISATPSSIDVRKVNGMASPSSSSRSSFLPPQLQGGMSPRTKLMMGVG